MLNLFWSFSKLNEFNGNSSLNISMSQDRETIMDTNSGSQHAHRKLQPSLVDVAASFISVCVLLHTYVQYRVGYITNTLTPV